MAARAGWDIHLRLSGQRYPWLRCNLVPWHSPAHNHTPATQRIIKKRRDFLTWLETCDNMASCSSNYSNRKMKFSVENFRVSLILSASPTPNAAPWNHARATFSNRPDRKSVVY